MTTLRNSTFSLLSVFALLCSFAACSSSSSAAYTRARLRTVSLSPIWSTFIAPSDLQRVLNVEDVLVIDVRTKEAYAEGHIPKAINIPAQLWTSSADETSEDGSPYLFSDEDGQPDIARYEALLSNKGVKNIHSIYVYGDSLEESNSTTPAMILKWLGHNQVRYLDGDGVEEWKNAGYALSQQAHTLPKTDFIALSKEKFFWNHEDVAKNVENSNVVYVGTRYENESAESKPGALRLDYSSFLGQDKKILPKSRIEALLSSKGITRDKRIVLYGQSATRISLPVLAMLDLGYPRVSIYDANRSEDVESQGAKAAEKN